AAPPPGPVQQSAAAEVPAPAGAQPASPQADDSVARLYREQEKRERAPAEIADTRSPAPAPAAAVQEDPVDIEDMLRRAREEMENARLVEHPAPFLASLSQVTKDAIPTVLYQRHDYSGEPGRSTVILNSKTLREGGDAAPGMKVREILPDSVVLDYRGTVFRLRALNSWVNL
ncbi:MAG: general secretion pathway protein GspB, partial [Halioglobus sp.]|nr:general secretion pathway protein GspB [Halioglobus sp.]